MYYEEPPQHLVIHVLGNDIGQKSPVKLRFEILDTFGMLTELMPNSLLVWSQVLPRIRWRNERSHKAVKKKQSLFEL